MIIIKKINTIRKEPDHPYDHDHADDDERGHQDQDQKSVILVPEKNYADY